MLWSRSLTNLLFFSFSVLFMIILSEWTAGERLPPLVSACILLAGCLGLTGEGVARSLGTAGGGTTSTTCPARSRLTPRGSGREEGRGTVMVLGLGLSGITSLHQAHHLCLCLAVTDQRRSLSRITLRPRVLAGCIFPWHSAVQIFVLKSNIFTRNFFQIFNLILTEVKLGNPVSTVPEGSPLPIFSCSVVTVWYNSSDDSTNLVGTLSSN